ncbi:dna helicase [Ophiostoma piceae UAMH 11346]|uniref:Dna helicase n=1 Tax=Ophiostoma piceae (strain UAMH 11346) TaxID=1262450 RepID=S3CUE0_OPHP1|nr:dna helicase [Ophiostoma piceae UAMH 11346]
MQASMLGNRLWLSSDSLMFDLADCACAMGDAPTAAAATMSTTFSTALKRAMAEKCYDQAQEHPLLPVLISIDASLHQMANSDPKNDPMKVWAVPLAVGVVVTFCLTRWCSKEPPAAMQAPESASQGDASQGEVASSTGRVDPAESGTSVLDDDAPPARRHPTLFLLYPCPSLSTPSTSTPSTSTSTLDDRLAPFRATTLSSHQPPVCPHKTITNTTTTTTIIPMFVHCLDPESSVTESMSRVNHAQNAHAISIIKEVISSGLQESDITMITPYRLNLACLKESLTANGLSIPVHTTDSFQGQEAPVIVVVLCTDRNSGPLFTAGQNRLCVATTRHSAALIIVGDIETVPTDTTGKDTCPCQNLDADPYLAVLTSIADSLQRMAAAAEQQRANYIIILVLVTAVANVIAYFVRSKADECSTPVPDDDAKGRSGV